MFQSCFGGFQQTVQVTDCSPLFSLPYKCVQPVSPSDCFCFLHHYVSLKCCCTFNNLSTLVTFLQSLHVPNSQHFQWP